MSKPPIKFKAWAVELGHGLGLAGRYYYERIIPVSLEGCRTALFDTRKAAEEHRAKSYYGQSHRVRRVTVTIKLAEAERERDAAREGKDGC